MAFVDIIAGWKEYGVFEFFLPFLLMFTIFYALLRKSKLFGEPKEKPVSNINIVVSLVAALFVMIYTPAGVSLTVFFSNFFTQTMVVLSTILSFALILYMLVPTEAMQDLFKGSAFVKILIPAAFLVVLFVFISAGGLSIFGIELEGPGSIVWPNLGISGEDVAFVIMLLGFLAVVLYLSKEGVGKKEKRVVRYKSIPVYEGEE
jgi:hypothetical protein